MQITRSGSVPRCIGRFCTCVSAGKICYIPSSRRPSSSRASSERATVAPIIFEPNYPTQPSLHATVDWLRFRKPTLEDNFGIAPRSLILESELPHAGFTFAAVGRLIEGHSMNKVKPHTWQALKPFPDSCFGATHSHLTLNGSNQGMVVSFMSSVLLFWRPVPAYLHMYLCRHLLWSQFRKI